MLNLYRLEQHITERMQLAHIPGFAIAIVQGDEIFYTRGFGVTSVEDSALPITPQTLFYIASTAKSITGTAIMRLVDVGQLDLDTPVKEYVPWLSFREKGAEKRITLRMLLSHTSGLPTSASNYGSRDANGIEEHVRDTISTYDFVAPPGKLYFYSNDGLVLAGYIAQRVSGQPFAELLQRTIFDPLEMRRTTYDPAVAMTYPLAQEHNLHEDGSLSVIHRYAYNTAYQPSGFLLSTVLDLANFASLHLNEGSFQGNQLLSTASISAMRTPQVHFQTVRDEGYGLTFRMYTYKGKRVIVHNGLFRATTTMFSFIPDAKVAVILLFNGFSAGSGAETIVHSIYDQLLSLPKKNLRVQAISADAAQWSYYTGTYLSLLGGLATVSVARDQLTLDINGRTTALQAYAKGRYFAQDTPDGPLLSVGFNPEADSPVQFITINGRAHQRIERDASYVARPTDWPAYTGTYIGDTGAITVRIAGEQLILHSLEDKMEATCLPFGPDTFVGDFGLIEFLRDTGGEVKILRRGKMFEHEKRE